MPCAPQLTPEEIDQITDDALDEIDRRMSLVEDNYQEMYAAVGKAFPLKEIFQQQPVRARKPQSVQSAPLQ